MPGLRALLEQMPSVAMAVTAARAGIPPTRISSVEPVATAVTLAHMETAARVALVAVAQLVPLEQMVFCPAHTAATVVSVDSAVMAVSAALEV